MLRRFTPHFQIAMSFLLALTALALLAGCEGFGTPKPETTAQRIAVTISSATAATETARTLLAAKKISADDAANIRAQADTVVAGARIARETLSVDPVAADVKLQQTIVVLRALQSYLAAKEANR